MDGLIFDFDGLILDTELPEYQTWQEIYQSYGCELPIAVWATCIGTADDVFDPYAYLEEQAGRPVEREQVAPGWQARYAELLAAQALLPGVLDYLRAGKRLGLKLAVASSSPHTRIDAHLERLGIQQYFDCVRCREDVAQTKPQPDLFLAALACLGLAPGEAIAFEDSPNGILAAKRAGLFTVAVPNALTGGLALDHADLRLSSLADLPLAELLGRVDGERSQ